MIQRLLEINHLIRCLSLSNKETTKLIAKDNFGADLAAVEAAQKKHEAIELDITAYAQRITTLVQKSKMLEDENYHAITEITTR